MEIEDNERVSAGIAWFFIGLGALVGFNTPVWMSITVKEAMNLVQFESKVLAAILIIFTIGKVIRYLKLSLGYNDSSKKEDDIEDFTPIQQYIFTGLMLVVGPSSVGYFHGQLTRIISFNHSNVLSQPTFVNGIFLGLCFTCAIVVYFEELRKYDSYELLKKFFE